MTSGTFPPVVLTELRTLVRRKAKHLTDAEIDQREIDRVLLFYLAGAGVEQDPLRVTVHVEDERNEWHLIDEDPPAEAG